MTSNPSPIPVHHVDPVVSAARSASSGRLPWGVLFGIVLGTGACVPDLTEELGLDDEEDQISSEFGDHLAHEDLDDDVVRTQVDARDEEDWVYLDLESRLEVAVDDPEDSDAWDLAFRRFDIKTNGGISGSGGVMGVALDDAAFDDVDAAPEDGYVEDADDGDDDNSLVDYVMHQWWSYSVMTHVLTPRDIVYVIKTVEDNYFKLQVDGYYFESGNSGAIAFRWAEIDAP